MSHRASKRFWREFEVCRGSPPSRAPADTNPRTGSAISRLGDGAYGMSVRQKLENRLKRLVSIGAVYTTLDRMREKGFVSSWIGEPTAERGGRAKKYFRVEAPGVEAINRSKEVSDAVWALLPVRAK